MNGEAWVKGVSEIMIIEEIIAILKQHGHMGL
jgi:hypothetical protein